MWNDLLIFKRVTDGDVQAFEVLFRRYYEPLCRYSQSFTGEWQDAEEIVQELFYKLWKERSNIHLFSVKAYLYGAVRNNSLQFLEHEQVKRNYRETFMEKPSEAKALTPEEHLEYKELEERLAQVLNRLPERRRIIFRMSRFEGKTYSEIANELSVSIKTVEAEMSKALKAMRENL